MANWGKCDYQQLKDLQEKINKLQKAEDAFCEECAKELVSRLLAKVIKRTPVGKYGKEKDKKTGKEQTTKMGGTLRRGWTAETEEDAVNKKNSNATEWAKSLKISKNGGMYQVEIINPVYYASYVEYGHRTPTHEGWVKGRFMLTISEMELETQAPQILEKKLQKFLGGML